LHRTVEMFAFGPQSPAQLIHRSPDLRADFGKILKTMEPDNKKYVSNLRAAKHRFESLQKPLGRTIKYFSAVHALMLRVACVRTSRPQQSAKQWLEFVAETPRNVLMCALLADAADEGMLLVRSFDSEESEINQIGGLIHCFLVRIYDLFGPPRKALELPGCQGKLDPPTPFVVFSLSVCVSVSAARQVTH
jgi:hypothetical protein